MIGNRLPPAIFAFVRQHTMERQDSNHPYVYYGENPEDREHDRLRRWTQRSRSRSRSPSLFQSAYDLPPRPRKDSSGRTSLSLAEQAEDPTDAPAPVPKPRPAPRRQPSLQPRQPAHPPPPQRPQRHPLSQAQQQLPSQAQNIQQQPPKPPLPPWAEAQEQSIATLQEELRALKDAHTETAAVLGAVSTLALSLCTNAQQNGLSNAQALKDYTTSLRAWNITPG